MTKGDRWIFIGILLICILLYAWRVLPSPGRQAVILEIRGPGRETFSLPVGAIPENAEKQWEIEGPAGGLVLAYMPEKGFYVRSASCPDHVCVKSGFISRAGQSIVCVPNAIIIALRGEGGEGGEALDGILR